MSCPVTVMLSVRPEHWMRSTVSGPTRPPARTETPCSKPEASASGLLATTMSRGSRRLRGDGVGGLGRRGAHGLLVEFVLAQGGERQRSALPGVRPFLTGRDQLLASAIEGLAADLRFEGSEAAVHANVGAIKGGLECDILALEDPALVLACHLPHLLDETPDRVEVQVPGPGNLLHRRPCFPQAGLLQDSDVGNLTLAYPFYLAVVQSLGQVHDVAGCGAMNIHA